MKEMRDALHPPKTIINHTAQTNLHNVKIVENSDKNGGLMKEMMQDNFHENPKNDVTKQKKLHQIDFGDTNHRVVR
ncbi:MAG: hypothetical protein PHV54_00395 [Tolumonas sp.]|nr:hypothetical protein [Tolumonas sp.]